MVGMEAVTFFALVRNKGASLYPLTPGIKKDGAEEPLDFL